MKNIPYVGNFEEWKKGFSFYQTIKVRFSETDLYGHLNNTVPFTYFEEARIEFFKQLGFMKSWLDVKSGKIPVVADLQCDFIKQVYFDERIKLFVKINHIGSSSLDIHYLALNNAEQPVFIGRGAIVQISKETGKSVPWTDEEKKEWSRCVNLEVG
ncbi:thioesterase family protein [Bacillus carboniphilus]|uniref:Thioesterase family protein n=1 Tax=Bacillus carboniphilus TaxID=86663 RepID=A0ABP3G3S8_9BACI